MKKQYIILIALIGLLAVSCTKDIDIELTGVSPQLVVDGFISTDTTTHTIYIKKTADYFSNQKAEGVSGALVRVSDGQNTVTLTEDANEKGAYRTPGSYFGKAGRTYTLTIENVDINNDGTKEKYEATCPLNPVPSIDDMRVEKTQLFHKDMWAIRINMQDPENERNYYLARNYRNNVCVSDSINEWATTEDEFFNGVYLNDETFMYFSSTKKDELLQSGDKIMMELCGITEDYLKYIYEVREEFQGRNPLFGGQPANIRTNIRQIYPTTSGVTAHGYFAAYSIARATTIFRE